MSHQHNVVWNSEGPQRATSERIGDVCECITEKSFGCSLKDYKKGENKFQLFNNFFSNYLFYLFIKPNLF